MTDAKKKILVVDDESDAVEGITAMLESSGYEVCSAYDGDSALAAARQDKPDLILLDVQMPGKDGFMTFADLRHDESMRDIPVVFLTGVAEKTGVHFSANDVGEYLGSEPEGYLEKPIDPARLLKAVGKALGA